jgi:hypothetical protein
MIYQLLVVLIVAGVVMWAVNNYLPMEPMIRNLLNFTVFLVLLLWVLHSFGLIPFPYYLR